MADFCHKWEPGGIGCHGHGYPKKEERFSVLLIVLEILPRQLVNGRKRLETGRKSS